MMNKNKGFALVGEVIIVVLVALAAGGAWYYYTTHSAQNSEQQPQPPQAQSQPAQQPVATGTATAQTQPASSSSGAITLDAATKAAVVQAVMNSFDILASNDPAKIRNYYLTEIQDPKTKAQFETATDAQILQIAAAAVGNAGKPPASLATNPAATWKLDGTTVTITTKSYAQPNPKYPAISNLTVTYQAVFINGAWY